MEPEFKSDCDPIRNPFLIINQRVQVPVIVRSGHLYRYRWRSVREIGDFVCVMHTLPQRWDGEFSRYVRSSYL